MKRSSKEQNIINVCYELMNYLEARFSEGYAGIYDLRNLLSVFELSFTKKDTCYLNLAISCLLLLNNKMYTPTIEEEHETGEIKEYMMNKMKSFESILLEQYKYSLKNNCFIK